MCSVKKIDFNTPAPDGVSRTRVFSGTLDASGKRFGIVVSRFNPELTEALHQGAVDALLEHGAHRDAIETARVPGAFEIPLLIERWAAARQFHALIALGCVIEGETPHAELISAQVTRALSDIGLRYGLPVIDTVVSTRNEAQAVARCRPGREGRGWYAGCAAIEMADLIAQLERAGR